MSQLPLPLHRTELPGPTSTAQSPEPEQWMSQSSPHRNSQPPEPAHCKSHDDEQSRPHGSLSGQTQSPPAHSHTPPGQLHAGPTQPQPPGGHGGPHATPTPREMPKAMSAMRIHMPPMVHAPGQLVHGRACGPFIGGVLEHRDASLSNHSRAEAHTERGHRLRLDRVRLLRAERAAVVAEVGPLGIESLAGGRAHTDLEGAPLRRLSRGHGERVGAVRPSC